MLDKILEANRQYDEIREPWKFFLFLGLAVLVMMIENTFFPGTGLYWIFLVGYLVMRFWYFKRIRNE